MLKFNHDINDKSYQTNRKNLNIYKIKKYLSVQSSLKIHRKTGLVEKKFKELMNHKSLIRNSHWKRLLIAYWKIN